jgi:hypothetical protein
LQALFARRLLRRPNTRPRSDDLIFKDFTSKNHHECLLSFVSVTFSQRKQHDDTHSCSYPSRQSTFLHPCGPGFAARSLAVSKQKRRGTLDSTPF